MSVWNLREGWGWPARALHWAVAAIILFQLGVGFYMVNVIEMTVDGITERTALTQMHKSWGFVVFSLVLVRLVWRLANRRPDLPEGMRPIERALSEGVHLALYALMLAMPLSGWLMASSSPLNDAGGYMPQIRNMVFGLFELPDPYAVGDKALSEMFGAVHAYAAFSLAVLVALHALAAVKHHVIDGDRVLMRMIRGR
ncbi:MAG: cytochrome b [Thermohalobaculum sp.]|nr:cytochrome b [Thermohalobaculum sp.]